MFSITLVKQVVTIVSGVSVAKVVGEVIKNNTVAVTTPQKVMINVGTFVLGSMVVEHACDYIGTQIDSLVEAHTNRKEAERAEIPQTPQEVSTQA